MTRYLSVALFTEGASDEAFLRRLLDGQLSRWVADHGTFSFDSVTSQPCRTVADHGVLEDAVDRATASFVLVVVHNDHREGGKARALAERIGSGRPGRLLCVIPVYETEAWALADPTPFKQLRGADTNRVPQRPQDIEKLRDPEAELKAVLADRASDDVFDFIGERVSLERLTGVPAHDDFPTDLTTALKELHHL